MRIKANFVLIIEPYVLLLIIQGVGHWVQDAINVPLKTKNGCFWLLNHKEFIMKSISILPAVLLGAASLAFSAGAIADTYVYTDPVTGLVRTTGAVVGGVGGAAVGLVGGTVQGVGDVVGGTANGLTHGASMGYKTATHSWHHHHHHHHH